MTVSVVRLTWLLCVICYISLLHISLRRDWLFDCVLFLLLRSFHKFDSCNLLLSKCDKIVKCIVVKCLVLVRKEKPCHMFLSIFTHSMGKWQVGILSLANTQDPTSRISMCKETRRRKVNFSNSIYSRKPLSVCKDEESIEDLPCKLFSNNSCNFFVVDDEYYLDKTITSQKFNELET